MQRQLEKDDELAFEAWILELSNGNADLHKNLYGDYDDPTVLSCLREWLIAEGKLCD